MRYVELRRHTDNDGDRLSEQGVSDAEAIGRSGLHPPYASFVSSGADRATEMLIILRLAAGQEETPITTETGLRSVVEDRWRAAAKAAGMGASVEDMRTADADLVEQESRLLGAALRRVVEGLPEGGRGLVVGHSPTNEAAVLGLVSQTISPLGKGEGVLVVEEEAATTSNPSPARTGKPPRTHRQRTARTCGGSPVRHSHRARHSLAGRDLPFHELRYSSCIHPAGHTGDGRSTCLDQLGEPLQACLDVRQVAAHPTAQVLMRVTSVTTS